MSKSGIWMSVREVARVMGISPATAMKLIKSGKAPGGVFMYRYDARQGEHWRVKRDVFEPWWAQKQGPVATVAA